MSEDLTAALAGLEKARQKMLVQRRELRDQLRSWILVSLAFLVAGLYAFSRADAGAVGGFLLAIAGGVFLFGLLVTQVVSGERGDEVSRLFKLTILPILAREIDPSLTYQIDGQLSKTDFKATGLYKSVDFYTGQDLFSGKIGQTDLRFSMAWAQEEYEQITVGVDARGKVVTKTQKAYRDIFQGVFFSADFNKHFSGTTRVWSGEAGILDEMADSHVELESPVFDARFKVRSTDQVEARYLLTPAMMDRLLALQAGFGKINAAFVGGQMAVLIPWRYRAFDPDLDQPLDEKAADLSRGNLRDIVGIVEALDLNTRIWTKEA